ncbi:hypothetical protein CXG81DRAFT_25847 [Caulochytrium protostelioides]|uniref:Uncharacterized protein n=1 Tax=Caulochytrium protostelioides TaxID=1555241 RepID=A0A4P9X8A4_9FUNG|nr:hypothetical protein CXG81DRAFT_25847 [Caulochytrium protostelioides]|eukprot:RKP01462.1 hypothetical protein CXG81DRAFT_25847 [Caulochytrium protostelioides]
MFAQRYLALRPHGAAGPELVVLQRGERHDDATTFHEYRIPVRLVGKLSHCVRQLQSQRPDLLSAVSSQQLARCLRRLHLLSQNHGAASGALAGATPSDGPSRRSSSVSSVASVSDIDIDIDDDDRGAATRGGTAVPAHPATAPAAALGWLSAPDTASAASLPAARVAAAHADPEIADTEIADPEIADTDTAASDAAPAVAADVAGFGESDSDADSAAQRTGGTGSGLASRTSPHATGKALRAAEKVMSDPSLAGWVQTALQEEDVASATPPRATATTAPSVATEGLEAETDAVSDDGTDAAAVGRHGRTSPRASASPIRGGPVLSGSRGTSLGALRDADDMIEEDLMDEDVDSDDRSGDHPGTDSDARERSEAVRRPGRVVPTATEEASISEAISEAFSGAAIDDGEAAADTDASVRSAAAPVRSLAPPPVVASAGASRGSSARSSAASSAMPSAGPSAIPSAVASEIPSEVSTEQAAESEAARLSEAPAAVASDSDASRATGSEAGSEAPSEAAASPGEWDNPYLVNMRKAQEAEQAASALSDEDDTDDADGIDEAVASAAPSSSSIGESLPSHRDAETERSATSRSAAAVPSTQDPSIVSDGRSAASAASAVAAKPQGPAVASGAAQPSDAVSTASAATSQASALAPLRSGSLRPVDAAAEADDASSDGRASENGFVEEAVEDIIDEDIVDEDLVEEIDGDAISDSVAYDVAAADKPSAAPSRRSSLPLSHASSLPPSLPPSSSTHRSSATRSVDTSISHVLGGGDDDDDDDDGVANLLDESMGPVRHIAPEVHRPAGQTAAAAPLGPSVLEQDAYSDDFAAGETDSETGSGDASDGF